MNAPAVERARAKINLTLRVLGRRADGYHELESLVAFADAADTLMLAIREGKPTENLTLDVKGPQANAAGPNNENLVLKAAAALRARKPELRCGRFTLDKRLPVAAGIGGGSADAAAALRLLALANGISLEDPVLLEVARHTGADVPVCLKSESCVMRGAGEVITPVPLPPLDVLLVNPGVALATKDVFAALQLPAGSVALPAVWPSERALLIEFLRTAGNDLEAPAISLQPQIAELLDLLRHLPDVQLARMSGSGATCFALFDNPEAASAAARTLQAQHPRWWVHAGVLGGA